MSNLKKYTNPKEPTPEQCNINARVDDFQGSEAYACWYPQMGGYVGRSVVVLSGQIIEEDMREDGACFDVYVWHDGEFPFSEDEERNPSRLHHCSPWQFIHFGQKVLKMQGVELNE